MPPQLDRGCSRGLVPRMFRRWRMSWQSPRNLLQRSERACNIPAGCPPAANARLPPIADRPASPNDARHPACQDDDLPRSRTLERPGSTRSLVITRTVGATDGPPAEVPDSQQSSTFGRPCGPEAGARRDYSPVVCGTFRRSAWFLELELSSTRSGSRKQSH